MSTGSTEQTKTPSDAENALSLLSQDERDALALDLGEGQVNAGDEGDEDDDDGAQDDADTGGKDAGAEKEAAPAAAGSEQATPAGEGVQAEGESKNEPEKSDSVSVSQAQAVAAPIAYSYKLPDDFDQRRTDLNAKFESLDKRLEDGDISTAEYGKELRALNREETNLDGMQQRAEIAREMTEQAAAAAEKAETESWAGAIDKLISEIEADASVAQKPDYRSDEALGAALGAQVNALLTARGNAPAATLDDKMALLRKAHTMLHFARTGEMPAAPAKEPEQKAPPVDKAVVNAAKKSVTEARKPDLSKTPPALSTLPGTDAPTGEDAEFLTISEMDGQAMEDALQKMKQRDPAKYERYLASPVA